MGYCNKPKHIKGLWSPEEDQKLRNYLVKNGHACWTSVPLNAGLQRNGKSCRLRWINYLRPGLKRGMFTSQEDQTILTLHHMFGNKWSKIAKHLAGRTDNDIKNYWHSYLKKQPTTKSHPCPTATTSTSLDNTSSSNSNSAEEPQTVSHFLQFPKPKIFFAEWLTFENSGDVLNLNDDSKFQNGILQDYNEGKIESWSSGEMLSSSLKLDDDQSVENDDWLIDFSSRDYMLSTVNLI